MRKKILVTGATGMLGTHVMLELLGRGYAVCGLKREHSDTVIVEKIFAHYKKTELYSQIEWREADMGDTLALEDATKDIGAVYHTAAMVSFDSKEHDRMWQTNVDGTANLIGALLKNGVEALCHASSIGAIGHTTDGSLIDEKTPFQPDSDRTVYSQSKFRQEMEVWRGIEMGLKAVIVNPGVILGPCAPNRSCGQIAMTNKKGNRYYVEGETGYVDARDVAKAMVELMEHEKFGERYVLVSENSTVRNLQNLFSEEFGVKKPTKLAKKWLMNAAATLLYIGSIFTGKKPSLTFENVRSMGGHNRYSSEKIKEAIGFKFVTLRESVENMAAFYK